MDLKPHINNNNVYDDIIYHTNIAGGETPHCLYTLTRHLKYPTLTFMCPPPPLAHNPPWTLNSLHFMQIRPCF